MKNLICLDIEVLPNYFLVCIQRLSNNKRVTFEALHCALTEEDREKLENLLDKYVSFGYNSLNYDIPLIAMMLDGKTPKEVYEASVDIIENRLPQYQFYKKYDITEHDFDHFDIQEPSPAVMISLKNYATRVGSKKLQEFYLDPHSAISVDEIKKLNKYCWNDVECTIDLYNSIKGRMELRYSMSDEYGLDLRSKSDAQIAEAVISSELSKAGIRAMKPTLPQDYKCRYTAPDYIKFEREDLQELLEEVENIDFELAGNGSVLMPKSLANKKIKIGNTVYKMGIGGLHSQEKKLSVVSDENYVMRNADFTSYYPFIILNNEFYPKHLGEGFLTVYRNIVEDRIKSKSRIPEIKAELKQLYGMIGKKG